MTPDEIEERLREAGACLIMMPMPKFGRPAGYRSGMPEPLRDYTDLLAAIVGSESPEQAAQEIAEAKNRVRLQPSAAEIERMDEAINWLWLVKGKYRRMLVSARMLYDPIRERHIISWRRLSREMGLHRDTLMAYHADAIEEIARRLREREAVT